VRAKRLLDEQLVTGEEIVESWDLLVLLFVKPYAIIYSI